MAWLKLHAAIATDPDVLDAGPDAANTLVAVLTLHKLCEWGACGVSSQATARALSEHWRDTRRTTVKRYAAGLAGLFRVGILILSDDGTRYTIRGWEKWQAHTTSTERVRAHRARKRSETLHETPPARGGEEREERRERREPPNPPAGGRSSPSALSGNGRPDEVHDDRLIVAHWAAQHSKVATGPLPNKAREYQRWLASGSGNWRKCLAYIEQADPGGLAKAVRAARKATT